MGELIAQIKTTIPFDLPESYICSGRCNGCSLKLLDFLELQLEEWEDRLLTGEQPNFGDLKKLARIARQVHRVMDRNDLLDDARKKPDTEAQRPREKQRT